MSILKIIILLFYYNTILLLLYKNITADSHI